MKKKNTKIEDNHEYPYDTYVRLRDGEPDYRHYLLRLMKYYGTECQTEKEVEKYFNTKFETFKYAIAVGIYIIGAFVFYDFLENSPTFSHSILRFIVPAIFLALAGYEYIKYNKFLDLAEDYRNVNNFMLVNFTQDFIKEFYFDCCKNAKVDPYEGELEPYKYDLD